MASALVVIRIRVFVPEPQVRIKAILELVVEVVFWVDFVQLFAQFLAVADDGRSMWSIGQFTCKSYTV